MILTAGILLLAPVIAAPQEKESCVASGLRWLMRHQTDDGRWSDADFVAQCREKDGGPCGGKGEALSDVGATAMALLAFHGAGYSHLSKDEIEGRRTGDAMKSALQWLMAGQAEDGSFGS